MRVIRAKPSKNKELLHDIRVQWLGEINPAGEIRMQQIVIAPFEGTLGASYSTLGLGTDGIVYRYDPKCEGWIPWSMKIAGCRASHKGKR
jgi:hypothetical protein